MSNPIEREDSPEPFDKPRRKRWQFGLRSLALLVLVVAVWLTAIANQRQIQRLEAQNATLRPMANLLMIDDPSQFAAVKLDELWMDDHRWDVYLPAGKTYWISLATRDIGLSGVAPVRQSVPIKPGLHRIALEFKRKGGGWPIRVTSDGDELIADQENEEWARSGRSMGNGEFAISTQMPTDGSLVLYRRLYVNSLTQGKVSRSPARSNGLLLWIEASKNP